MSLASVVSSGSGKRGSMRMRAFLIGKYVAVAMDQCALVGGGRNYGKAAWTPASTVDEGSRAFR